MLDRPKLKPIVLAMLPLFAVSSGYAAEQTQKEKNAQAKEAEVEIIEVTGYRGSVQKSIFDKRNSSNIVDSIFSEDIGKNTDQNIADALSRVTGVSVTSVDGEGSTISIRGAGSSFNNISLNGVQLTSSDQNSSVDLSSFSSDILSSIQVYKTSSADHDEGSLGANVVLKTPNPLTYRTDKKSLELQLRHNQYSGNNDYKVGGSFSKKLFDETFGVLVTASSEKQGVRRDSYLAEQPKWVTVDAGGATTTTGELLDEKMQVLRWHSTKYDANQNQRDRNSINTVFSFVPDDATEVKLNLSVFKQTVENDQHQLQSTTSADGSDNNATDPQAQWWTVDVENKTFTKYLNRLGSGRIARTENVTETDNKVVTLNALHYITDNLSVEFTAGYANTNLTKPYSFGIQTGTSIDKNDVRSAPLPDIENGEVYDPSIHLNPMGYDCSQGLCQFVYAGSGGTYSPNGERTAVGSFTLNPLEHNLSFIRQSLGETNDVNRSVFLDFDWDVDFNGVTQLEFGVKSASRTKDYSANDVSWGRTDVIRDINGNFVNKNAFTPDIDLVAKQALGNEKFPYDNFMEGITSNYNNWLGTPYDTSALQGWPLLSATKIYDIIFDAPFTPEVDDTNSTNVTQDTKALYAKANFTYLDDRLTGDIGLRYVKTTTTPNVSTHTLNYNGGTNNWDYLNMKEAGLFAGLGNGFLPSGVTSSSIIPECSPFNADFKDVRIDYNMELYNAGHLDPDSGLRVRGANGGYIIQPDDVEFDDTTQTYSGWVDKNGKEYNTIGEEVTPEYSFYDGSNAKCQSTDIVTSPFTSSGLAGNNQLKRFTDESSSSAYGLNHRRRVYQAETSTWESEIWLPSLNLNYVINDKTIFRFAASKTMARPRFESLRAGFRVNERGREFDTGTDYYSDYREPTIGLKPIVSNNLDLSLEWYFNQTGQLSIALFNKDMQDFVTRIYDKVEYYLVDRMENYGTENTLLTPEDILIPIAGNEGLQPGQTVNNLAGDTVQCARVRMNTNDTDEAAWSNNCIQLATDSVRNAGSATTRGIEFTYRQTYDFLPGIWSNLGSNIGYTLQKSENKTEEYTLDGRKLSGLPQERTPKHSLNSSIYWEKSGHSVRLSYRYNSMQFVREYEQGAVWQEAKGNLDLAINYKLNKQVSLRFDALNLTDEETREFWTSRTQEYNLYDANGDVTGTSYLDEGNPMDNSNVTQSRTHRLYKTGKNFRLSVRANF